MSHSGTDELQRVMGKGVKRSQGGARRAEDMSATPLPITLVRKRQDVSPP
jgi:hypothetical protein